MRNEEKRCPLSIYRSLQTIDSCEKIVQGMCKKAVANRIPRCVPSKNHCMHSRQSSSQLPALSNLTCTLVRKASGIICEVIMASIYSINLKRSSSIESSLSFLLNTYTNAVVCVFQVIAKIKYISPAWTVGRDICTCMNF